LYCKRPDEIPISSITFEEIVEFIKGLIKK
jgi:hypothetical protein